MKPSLAQLLKARQKGDERIYLPLHDFKEVYESIVKAEKEATASDLSEETKWMLHRGYIISIVTAVEVYFRDMFGAFGNMARASGIILPLNKIHSTAYSIDEMQAFYHNKITPHDVVANSLNFQSYRHIGAAFTHLLGKSFWPGVIELSVKESPGMAWMVTEKSLESFKATLKLRHELVHNPRLDIRLSEKQLNGVPIVLFVVMAADALLVRYIISKLIVSPVKKKKTSK